MSEICFLFISVCLDLPYFTKECGIENALQNTLNIFNVGSVPCRKVCRTTNACYCSVPNESAISLHQRLSRNSFIKKNLSMIKSRDLMLEMFKGQASRPYNKTGTHLLKYLLKLLTLALTSSVLTIYYTSSGYSVMYINL